MKHTEQSRAQSFWSRVNKDGPTMPHMDTPCWEYTGAVRNGYGYLEILGIKVLAHRYAWELESGPPPAVTRHRCDNTRCVRRSHLEDGGQAKNIRDAYDRGRRTQKLTSEQRAAIRAEYAEGGVTMAELGSRYGVSAQAVHGYLRRG